MNKGQQGDPRIKNILKFFKLNEDTISTLMGIVVVILIGGMMFNYFRTSNLKTWQGVLLNEESPATTSAEVEEKKTQEITTYKVVKGDDLWHIAEEHYKSGYNYVDLIKENKLDSNGVITAGMELRIPKVESKKLTVTGVVKKEMVLAEKSTVATSIEPGEYITKKGDTYWNIAVRAYGDGFKWTKIYWENRKTFSNPDLIEFNTKITIPKLQ